MVILITISILTLLISGIIFNNIRDKRLLLQVTNNHRGMRSERELVIKLLKNKISAKAIFHDLYLKKSNGRFSQIDLVVPTKVGIVVFEIKDYSGWIFGNGKDRQWTQVLAYGKEKYRFYNPVAQNKKHIEDLKQQLKPCGDIPFYSVIVFCGNCTLKDISYIPNRTYVVKSNRVIDVLNVIQGENSTAIYTNKRGVVKVLREAVLNGENTDNQIQHIKNIEDMIGRQRVFN